MYIPIYSQHIVQDLKYTFINPQLAIVTIDVSGVINNNIIISGSKPAIKKSHSLKSVGRGRIRSFCKTL